MDPSDDTVFETVKRRVQERIDELGTNMKAVSLAAELGETFVRDMLRRNRAPSVESLDRVATALKTTSMHLMGGERPEMPIEALPPFEVELVTVAEYDVRVSAGGGALIERENQSGVWQFSRRYLEGELRLTPANLAIVEVEGDSMFPTLWSGDRILVDHQDVNAAKPGIYAIWDSNATVVKRIEKVPASDPPMIVLISDNKNHNEYCVPLDAVKIIGRVVWYARRL